MIGHARAVAGGLMRTNFGDNMQIRLNLAPYMAHGRTVLNAPYCRILNADARPTRAYTFP